MVFVHPPKHDFDDAWPEGWKWADVEASAASLYERNPGTIQPSTDGIWYDAAEYDVLSSFLATQNFTNVNPMATPDHKTKVFTHPPWNIKDGMRAGPVRTYLPLAQKKTGFSLQMYSNVLRVARIGPRVTGVEVEDANTGGPLSAPAQPVVSFSLLDP
jgi:cellobiose dehydrogenase (acceptor)